MVAKDCHTLVSCLRFARIVQFGNVTTCRGGGGGSTGGGGSGSGGRGKWGPPPPEADNDLSSNDSDDKLIEYAVS
jgi:hypothetical protein